MAPCFGARCRSYRLRANGTCEADADYERMEAEGYGYLLYLFEE